MGSKRRNLRRSQWRVMNRCLNILLRLLHGRASSEKLRSIIIDDAKQDERELSPKALDRLFEEDKKRLRAWFAIDWNYDRSQDEYELVYVGRSLVDLSDDAVRGLAFLQQTFSDDTVPMATDVRTYLNTVSMLLPRERLKQVEKQRGLLEMELRARETDNIGDDVWETVEISNAQHRQLEFDYLSPQQADGIPRRKVVEPIRHFFDTVRKHYYLEAFALTSYAPHKGLLDQKREVRKYRLDRMSNPKTLPKHFNPTKRIPTKELIYKLNANVARLGVTEHFPDMQVFPNNDGSAEIVVKSRDLFFDLRTLLYYGANCRIIGGAEAVWQMKEIVKNLYGQYFDVGDIDGE